MLTKKKLYLNTIKSKPIAVSFCRKIAALQVSHVQITKQGCPTVNPICSVNVISLIR